MSLKGHILTVMIQMECTALWHFIIANFQFH